MNRRDFLIKSAYASGLVLASQTLPPWLGRAHAQDISAAAADDHFLLVLRVNGAWDVTLAMDARYPTELKKAGIDDKDYYFLNTDEEVLKVGDALLAPPAHSIAKYMNDIAVINGIMMMSNNTSHESNRAYMASGSTASGEGAFPFQLAMGLGDAPLGVAYGYEYETVDTGGYSSMTTIRELLSQGPVMQSDVDSVMRARVKQAARVNGRARAKALFGSQITAVDANKKISRMSELATQYQSMLTVSNDRTKAVASVLGAFAAGTVRYAVYDFQSDGSLDTHGNHKIQQPKALTECFANLAAVIDLLKTTGLFEKTTVVVMSEFARTPYKEGDDGTGHNPFCNSALLFGKNIQGGRVHGSSRVWSRAQTAEGRSRLQANLYDFNAGRVVSDEVLAEAVRGTIKVGACTAGVSDTCVDYIYPESVWKTVAQGFGLTEGTKAVQSALTIPGLLKKS